MINQNLGGFRQMSRRNVHNADMAQRTHEILRDANHPGAQWFLTKSSIATELGRVSLTHDMATLLALADDIFKSKPKVKDIVARLRAWRLGKDKADSFDLARLVGACVNTYRRQHKAATWAQIREALAIVQAHIADKTD